jgi:hypothetical protein
MLRWLHGVCGNDLLMLVDKYGTSCALIATQNSNVGVLRCLYELCGKELLMLVDKDGESCAYVAALEGQVDKLRWLHGVCGNDLLMLGADRASVLTAAIGNEDMCRLLVQLGGLELVSAKDARGWTFLHRLVYGGDDALACEIASVSQGEALLDVARREVAEYHDDAAKHGGGFVVHRGFPSDLKVDRDDRSIDFITGFSTVTSQSMCPVGGRGYFELEIISMSTAPLFGFADAHFPASRGKTDKGVGFDSSSWSVDGARKRKRHGGEKEKWDCSWRDGDVIGLACDLVEGKLHVSLNGEFSAPNGCVFEIDVEECSGLFAAFTADNGKVRYNLGEAAFKHDAPAGSDYTAFLDFPPKQN